MPLDVGSPISLLTRKQMLEKLFVYQHSTKPHAGCSNYASKFCASIILRVATF